MWLDPKVYTQYRHYTPVGESDNEVRVGAGAPRGFSRSIPIPRDTETYARPNPAFFRRRVTLPDVKSTPAATHQGRRGSLVITKTRDILPQTPAERGWSSAGTVQASVPFGAAARENVLTDRSTLPTNGPIPAVIRYQGGGPVTTYATPNFTTKRALTRSPMALQSDVTGDPGRRMTPGRELLTGATAIGLVALAVWWAGKHG